MQATLTLFGSYQLFVDGASVKFATEHSRALLAYLAMEPGVHDRSTLATLLWSERPEATARQNLRQTLVYLKQSLRPFPQLDTLFVTTNKNIEVQSVVLTTDAQRFSQLLATCAAHTHSQLVFCEECMTRLQEAVQLYRGEFLEGLIVKNSPPLEEWVFFWRDRLHRQALEILDTLTRHNELVADYSQMQDYASLQLTLEPWREEAYRQMMRALALSGQSTAALVYYGVCQRTLVEELGIQPSPATTALYERIQRGEFDGAMQRLAPELTTGEVKVQAGNEANQAEASESSQPLATHLLVPHNLPTLLSPFIGREQEVDDITQVLADPETRLLTLVGLGGIGKTRLAIEAAQKIYSLRTTHTTKAFASANFRNGFFFISLASLSSSSALAPTIAATLGIDPGGDPHQVVINYLRNKALLLILDNFEHLLDGVPLVVEMLEQAPRVKIVVTSRERLNVRSEQLYPVPPLTHAQHGELAEALTWSAVRLFVERARRVSPHFKVTESNLPALLRICGLVQGMPLGLEIAAAWCSALSLEGIAAEIERGIDFLSVDYYDLPERQRSIRTVFTWSWQQLNEAERQTLRRIAHFRGGFTLHAAQTVAGATLPILIRLIHKSLLQWQENPTGGGRYTMHELLRQFAAEQLDSAEHAAVEEKHSHYYLAYLAEWGVRLGREAPVEAGAKIQIELDNIRQAWQWAVRTVYIAGLDQASYGWWQFCIFRGLGAESRATFASAIESLRQRLPALSNAPVMQRQGERVLSKFLAIYANNLFAQSLWERMAELAQEAIALGQASGGLEGEVFGYFVLGRALQELEQWQAALEMYVKTSEIARRYRLLDPNREMLVELELMGYSWRKGMMQYYGDYRAARECLLPGVQLCRSLGKVRSEMAFLVNLALNSAQQGDYASARKEFEQALPHFRMFGSPVVDGSVHYEYGEILRIQGEYVRAKAMFERAVTILRACASHLEEAYALNSLVLLHWQLGDGGGADVWCSQLHQITDEQELTYAGRAQLSLAFVVHAMLAGDYERARADAEQTWPLVERFVNFNGHADAAVILGHARCRMNDWDAAATAYQKALSVYMQVGNAALAVEAEAGLAQVALAQDDPVLAQQLVEKILPMLNEATCSVCYTPFFIWLTCFQVLAANHDPRSVAILQRGYALLQRYAQAIPNEGLRRSFLEQVPYHCALQEAYAEGVTSLAAFG